MKSLGQWGREFQVEEIGPGAGQCSVVWENRTAVGPEPGD